MLSHFSHVQLFATLWTAAHEAPLSMEFSRQEYWSGLPFPSPGDLPDPGIKSGPPALQADYLPSEPPGKPNKTNKMMDTQVSKLLKKQVHKLSQGQLSVTWANYFIAMIL